MHETLEENPPWQVSWVSLAPSRWLYQVYVLVSLAFLCGLPFELSPVLLASTIDQRCVRQYKQHPLWVLVPPPPQAQTGMVSVHVPESGSTESWVSIASSSVSGREVHFYWMYSTL